MKGVSIRLIKTLTDLIPPHQGITAILHGLKSEPKNKLIREYVIGKLEKEETVVIVSLTQSAEDVIEELTLEGESQGMLVNTALMNEYFFVIDAFSFRTNVSTVEAIPGTVLLENAEDLTSMSIAIDELSSQRAEGFHLIIWPFSLLALYNGITTSLNFIQTVSARIRQRKQTALLVLDEGVLTERELAILRSVVDTFIETRHSQESNSHEIRAPFVKSTAPILNWIPFATIE